MFLFKQNVHFEEPGGNEHFFFAALHCLQAVALGRTMGDGN